MDGVNNLHQDNNQQDENLKFYQKETQYSSHLVKMHNTLVDMLRDRNYKIAKGSEYDEEKFAHPNQWILKGNHYVKQDFNSTILVYYIKQSSHIEQVIKDLNNCRIIFILEDNSKVRIDKAQQLGAFNNHNVYIEFFEEKRLLFNVTKHFLVPKHVLLDEEQKKEILEKLMLKETELQTISMDDPVAKYFGMLERQVVMIIRHSENTGKFVSFRICVDSGKSSK